MTEWIEIYNAPDWGLHIILYCDVNEMVASGYYNGDYWQTVDGIRLHPTHWMPLPEPPKPE